MTTEGTTYLCFLKRLKTTHSSAKSAMVMKMGVSWLQKRKTSSDTPGA